MRLLSRSFPRGIGAASIAAMMAFSLGVPAMAEESLPFSDRNAKGFIAFCDQQKKPVTSGSIYDQPFVWTAVSSTPAPDGYKKGKAVLIAYQPREGVEPGLWSGRQLTASSTFTNPKHPMAQATYADDPLLYFTQSNPLKWDGLVQLRMYLSAPEIPVYKTQYPATTVRVTGDRWSVVSGGNVACNVGTATSVASLTLPKSKLASPAPLRVAGSPGAQSTSGSRLEGLSKSAANEGGFGGRVLAAGLIVVALLCGGTGAFYLRQRRRAAMDT